MATWAATPNRVSRKRTIIAGTALWSSRLQPLFRVSGAIGAPASSPVAEWALACGKREVTIAEVTIAEVTLVEVISAEVTWAPPSCGRGAPADFQGMLCGGDASRHNEASAALHAP